MAAEHTGLLADTHFWVLMATVIFAVVAYKKGRAPLLGMLDGRTAKIKADLEEAERLKAEAQELLADIQKKQRDALQTSKKIIDSAKEAAERIRKESEESLSESLKRRETQLIDRIARAETAAVQELRMQAADIAAKSAEIILQDVIGKRGPKLVDDAIGEIPARLR